MLVSIALTAATVGLCTAPACTKRLNETQWPETRDETYWAEPETLLRDREKTETLRILSETRR